MEGGTSPRLGDAGRHVVGVGLDQGAEQFFGYPGSLSEPWVELAAGAGRQRGFYLGAHDPANRRLILHMELQPGNSQTPRWDGNWPRRKELGGLPAGVLMSFVDFPNHSPGTIYEAAPVILQAHQGGAQEGQRCRQHRKKSN